MKPDLRCDCKTFVLTWTMAKLYQRMGYTVDRESAEDGVYVSMHPDWRGRPVGRGGRGDLGFCEHLEFDYPCECHMHDLAALADWREHVTEPFTMKPYQKWERI